jgi:hypothetical protein
METTQLVLGDIIGFITLITFIMVSMVSIYFSIIMSELKDIKNKLNENLK